eukprot:m.120012 g.120012  ORF g.120012 m.120012 type:complete len:971 (-) comp28781_c1_seq1:100-3012(-)
MTPTTTTPTKPTTKQTPTKRTPVSEDNNDFSDNSSDEPGTLAQRAESMFINNKIEKIKLIQRENRGTIENKKEELRQLVGERYRDLIDAADTIVTMASSAAEVVGSVVKMQKLCNQIQHGSQLFGQREYDPTVANPLCAVAIQMKLLMDAPEQLWSALEEKSFYSATRIFLLARTVFTRMKIEKDEQPRNDTPKLTHSFPILSRQWDSIQPFKESIIRGAKDLLKSPACDVTESVAALTAIVLMDRLSIKEAFEIFLNARRDAADDILKDTSVGSTFKSKVCLLMKLLTKTICDIYFIFGNNGDSFDEDVVVTNTTPAQLLRFLSTALSTPLGEDIELGRISGSHLLAQTMPSSVKDFKPTLEAPLAPLNKRELKESSQKWLQELTDIVQDNCCKLIRFVEDIDGLTRARDAVWLLLDEEYQIEFAERKLSEILSDDSSAWGWLCKQTVGIEVELWKHLLEHVFAQRSQTILTGMFRVASETTLARVSASVQDLAQQDSCVDSLNLTHKIWSSPHKTTSTQQKEREVTVGLDLCGPDVVAVVESLQQRLRLIIETSQALLEDSDADHGSKSSVFAITPTTPKTTATRRAKGFPFDKYAGAGEVRRFLQRKCEESVTTFTEHIDKQRQSLVTQTTSSNTIDQVLFLGRVCRAVSMYCNEISTLVLLPSQNNAVVNRKRRSNVRHHAQPTEHEQRLVAVKEIFSNMCTVCHAVWTEHYSNTLATAFRNRLLGLDWQCFAIQKRTWQQHSVEEESETGEKVASIIRLPSQPSGFVLSMLCGVCAEINRVGGHTVEQHVLKELTYNLFTRTIVSYETLLGVGSDADTTSEPPVGLSQDGCLQILFDVAFLGDVLVGASVGKERVISDNITRLNIVIAKAKDHIDPFDLVVFMPLIETSRSKMFFRCATLLGYLTQLYPISGGVRPTLSSTESSNTMPMADVAPRFPLLPVGSASVKPTVRPKRAAIHGAALFAI